MCTLIFQNHWTLMLDQLHSIISAMGPRDAGASAAEHIRALGNLANARRETERQNCDGLDENLPPIRVLGGPGGAEMTPEERKQVVKPPGFQAGGSQTRQPRNGRKKSSVSGCSSRSSLINVAQVRLILQDTFHKPSSPPLQEISIIVCNYR